MIKINPLYFILAFTLLCSISFGQINGTVSNFNTPDKMNLESNSDNLKINNPNLRQSNVAKFHGAGSLNKAKKNINNKRHLYLGGADAGGGNYLGVSIEDVKAELIPNMNKLDHEIDRFLTSIYLLKLIDLNSINDETLKKVVTKVLFGFSTQHQLTQVSVGRWNFQEDPITKNQYDLIINAIRYNTDFLEEGNCNSKEKDHNLASTQFKLGSRICLSLKNLTQYPRVQLLRIVLPIIFHEIAHQYGFDEVVAQKFEMYIRHIYEKSKILQLNRVLQNQLNNLLKNKEVDPLDIARIFETKGQLFNIIKNSNYIDLFMLSHIWGHKEVEGLLTKIYRPQKINIWEFLAPNGYYQHYSVDPLVIDDPVLKNNSTNNSQIKFADEISILLNSTELIELIIRTSNEIK